MKDCKSLYNSLSSHLGRSLHNYRYISYVYVFPATDDKPRMMDLISFHGKNEIFSIMDQIGSEYWTVGIHLLNDENGTIVSSISSEHRGNVKQINWHILSRWLQGKETPDITWRGLLAAVKGHCPRLARDIEETLVAKEKYSSTAPPFKKQKRVDIMHTKTTAAEMPHHTPSQPQYTLSDSSDELRDRYAEYPHPHFSNPQCYKWMLMDSEKYEYIHPFISIKNPQQDTEKQTVLLQLHPYISTKSGVVQLQDMLSIAPGEKCRCFLLEGAPGMGKSTLVWQICHLWGKRELFDQYSIVLLLPLRDKRVQLEKQVEDLFPSKG